MPFRGVIRKPDNHLLGVNSLQPKEIDQMIEYPAFKLWTGAGNGEVIISAHGGRSLLGGRGISTGFKKKKVPSAMSLAFYGPDRSVIVSGTVKYEFIDHNLAGQPYKIKPAGASYVDYELTKFQGYHGNEDETYEVVKDCLGQYDVITIRHRPLKLGGSIMLSDLLKTLIDSGHAYSVVHCSFCRCFSGSIMDLFKGRPDYTTPT
jgi:hypothetical protein